MSSTLESELNNLIGFFKRSTLTFEIRIRYVNFTLEIRKLHILLYYYHCSSLIYAP